MKWVQWTDLVYQKTNFRKLKVFQNVSTSVPTSNKSSSDFPHTLSCDEYPRAQCVIAKFIALSTGSVSPLGTSSQICVISPSSRCQIVHPGAFNTFIIRILFRFTYSPVLLGICLFRFSCHRRVIIIKLFLRMKIDGEWLVASVRPIRPLATRHSPFCSRNIYSNNAAENNKQSDIFIPVIRSVLSMRQEKERRWIIYT